MYYQFLSPIFKTGFLIVEVGSCRTLVDVKMKQLYSGSGTYELESFRNNMHTHTRAHTHSLALPVGV